MKVHPLGDSALLVRLREDFARDPEANLRAVLQAQGRLEAAALPGVIECAPAYDSIGVFFDPAKVNDAGVPAEEVFPWLAAKIRETLAPKEEFAPRAQPRVVEIPVCYEPEFALDLEEVARHSNLSLGEVVQRHSSADYLVHCLGFLPGFPYLGGLPPELATPRRATPRTKIPAGAVAIGGGQTGIYPTTSPGGWNVIGRTPLRLFDPASASPTLLEAGDRVRFRVITRAQFKKLSR